LSGESRRRGVTIRGVVKLRGGRGQKPDVRQCNNP
jgi:hypothetical protein